MGMVDGKRLDCEKQLVEKAERSYTSTRVVNDSFATRSQRGGGGVTGEHMCQQFYEHLKGVCSFVIFALRLVDDIGCMDLMAF
jgi:hypothetical protein